MPTLGIEPTVACQLSCRDCVTGKKTPYDRKASILPENAFINIFDNKYFENAGICGYGEPLLYNNLPLMLKELRERNYYITIHTNGQKLLHHANTLVDHKVNNVSIAVDGLTQDIYEQYRIGGKLDVILEGVREIARLKNAIHSPFPRLTLQFILFEHNICQMDEVIDFAKHHSFDQVDYKSSGTESASTLYHRDNVNKVIAKRHHMTPYIDQPKRTIHSIFDFHKLPPPHADNNNMPMDFSKSSYCFNPVVLCDGSVSVCCLDFLGKNIVGNIHTNTLDEIMESERYRHFLVSLMSPFGWPGCGNCKQRPRLVSPPVSPAQISAISPDTPRMYSGVKKLYKSFTRSLRQWPRKRS